MADKVSTSSHRIIGVTGAHEATGRTGVSRAFGTGRGIAVTGAHEATERTGKNIGSETGAASDKHRENSGTIKISTSGVHRAVTEKTSGYESKSAGAVKKQKEKRRKAYIISLTIAAIMIVAAAVIFRSVTERTKYNRYIDEAQAGYASGEYDEALLALRKAAALDNTDDCGIMMARCYAAQQNYDKALEILRTLNTSDSTIQNLIAEMENQKSQSLLSGLVYIAGTGYEATTSELTLRGKGLTDSDVQTLSEIYGLTSLSLADNNISDLSPISSLGGLATLDLTDNDIQDISALSSLTLLRTLILDDNPITDFTPLYGLQALTNLSVRGCSISEEQLSELAQALPQCAISMDVDAAENRDITIGGKTFSLLVEKVDLSGCGITDISVLSSCTNLKEINLSDNLITDISPLMDIPGLETIILDNNEITDLRPLISLENVTYLSVSENEISSLVPLASLKNLTYLNLDGNPLTDLSGIENLNSLATLLLSGTGIDSSAFALIENMPSLNYIDITDICEISSEDYQELSHALPGCTIVHSDLVYSIEIAGENISIDTEEIVMSNRGLTELPSLTKFSNLKKIDFSGNSISSIGALGYIGSNPTEINLSNNLISEIGIMSTVWWVERLDLSYNNISSINSLLSLTHLKYLNIRGNNITEEQVDQLKNALPDCEIVY